MITGDLNDYATLKATMLPYFELDRLATPTDVKSIGAKGAGEAGTVALRPAVASAVIVAVSHPGGRHPGGAPTREKIGRAVQRA